MTPTIYPTQKSDSQAKLEYMQGKPENEFYMAGEINAIHGAVFMIQLLLPQMTRQEITRVLAPYDIASNENNPSGYDSPVVWASQGNSLYLENPFFEFYTGTGAYYVYFVNNWIEPNDFGSAGEPLTDENCIRLYDGASMGMESAVPSRRWAKYINFEANVDPFPVSFGIVEFAGVWTRKELGKYLFSFPNILMPRKPLIRVTLQSSEYKLFPKFSESTFNAIEFWATDNAGNLMDLTLNDVLVEIENLN